ncbi:MAG: response regulator transcription factor [Acidimicrobiia bacterium]|nr:response regulator transcription factor [Acidimicrobiia bacterium]NNF09678.1 response regulator transcription factor [Acidimicrobiia bacterium]NNL68775.1 response regulator transcription factor [Acidimicrobiia bacterium]
MTKPRILVVDDDERIAASVRRSLTYDGYDVAVAHDGPGAIEAVRSHPPDVIVLDLMLPGIDGLEVCRRLRAAGDDVAVLMLTARGTIPDRVTGLDAGADDYLVKPFAHEELLARVRSLLRRAQPTDANETLRFADLVMDVDAMEVRRGDRHIELTTLEFSLLEYFLRNARIVLSRSRIRQAVWDLDADTTSNVVDVYVRYLRQKIETDDAPPLLHTVRGAGYILK